MSEIMGFVNILKPTGMSSSDVVCKVKKILKTKKVGHLGTLDPAASGVLPIAVGKATKFFDYFLKKDKEYYAICEFGIETDTLDSFGNITNKYDIFINKEQIESVIHKFIGKVSQVPPKYSAIKINGKKACDLARNDIEFEIKPREVEIYNIELLKEIAVNKFLFKVHCSAGTYIRTLLNDIANALGIVATTPVIIRTKSGRFVSEKAITLEELEKQPECEKVEEIFNDYKIITINNYEAKKLINGVSIEANKNIIEKEFLLEYEGKLLGLYEIKNGKYSRIVYLYN